MAGQIDPLLRKERKGFEVQLRLWFLSSPVFDACFFEGGRNPLAAEIIASNFDAAILFRERRKLFGYCLRIERSLNAANDIRDKRSFLSMPNAERECIMLPA